MDDWKLVAYDSDFNKKAIKLGIGLVLKDGVLGFDERYIKIVPIEENYLNEEEGMFK